MSTQHVGWNLLACVLVACLPAACSGPRVALPADGTQRFEFSRLAMGVEARIVLHARSEADARAAAESAFATIGRLDEVLSDWTETSAASHLCAHAGEGPIEVPAELFDVIEQSLDIARRTDGAFDPTVGPLVALWRRARALGRMPDPAEIEHARALVGADLVRLDPTARTVELARAGMRLDFGAIGKGFACQRAIETLGREGVASALVQMGGDLVCSDPPPGTDGWSVDLPALSAAGAQAGARAERVLLAHAALSVSGDAEQRLEIGGIRRSHVIDPHSGLGLTSGSLSIVVAPDGATSDALATAAGVLGPERGIAVIARFAGCEGRMEEPSGIRRETAGFARLRREFREDR
jgi:thiamine biosynthesis lipoprotein